MKTYETWARLVKTREDVPVTFKGFFDSATTNEKEFPYTIFAPPDRVGRRKTFPRLICLLSDRIAICEKHSKELKTISITYQDISLLETGTILLNSWIKIAGITPEGPLTTMIEFNTVVKEFFRPLMERVRVRFSRLNQRDISDEALRTEQHKFKIYAKNHYKFMNYAIASILPGENVLNQVLQPDVFVKFMKYFHKLAVTSHLTILTNHELIIIREPDQLPFGGHVRYGGVWTFIPLAKICDVSIVERLSDTGSKQRTEDSFLTLNVVLADKNSVNSRFEPLQRVELERFIQNVKNNPYGFTRECS